MAIVDLDFKKWLGQFRAYNPDLFTGKHGLAERMATDIAQIAFSAGKNAARTTPALSSPRADVGDEWNPHYGKSPGEAWRKGFSSGIARAQGALYLTHAQAVVACRSVGIENPHNQNCEKMQALMDSQGQRIQVVADRILGASTTPATASDESGKDGES